MPARWLLYPVGVGNIRGDERANVEPFYGRAGECALCKRADYLAALGRSAGPSERVKRVIHLMRTDGSMSDVLL